LILVFNYALPWERLLLTRILAKSLLCGVTDGPNMVLAMAIIKMTMEARMPTMNVAETAESIFGTWDKLNAFAPT
jgi:hypothetical protein